MHRLASYAVTGVLLSLATMAQAQAASVTEVFNGDMLGTNLRYFESVAGIARQSFGDEHHFRVQGCNITATAAGGTVSALRMEITPECPVDLSTFVGDSFAPASNQPLTFGSLASAAGDLSYYSDCLSSCGNAADPSVYALWDGPHAANFIQVLLEVSLVDDSAIEASGRWRNAMLNAKGEDFVMETKFNCDHSFDREAQQAFANVTATAVTIGTDLRTPACY